MRIWNTLLYTAIFLFVQELNNQAKATPAPITTEQSDVQQQISTALPTGWVMRLPTQLSRKSVASTDKVVISSPTSAGLTVSVFTCEAQLPSCLWGSFTVAAKTSASVQKELRKHQAATALALPNQIQGYLLEGSKSIMWEQDNQIYTAILPGQSLPSAIALVSEMVQSTPISSQAATEKPTTVSQPVSPIAQTSSTQPEKTYEPKSLLLARHPGLATAQQLRQGEIVLNTRYRQSFPPGTEHSVGLTGQPTFGISWGVTNGLEVTLDSQTVDNSGPMRQGPYSAQRINPDGYGPNFFEEFTLQAKQRLWQNQSGTQALSGVIAASLGNGGRPYEFFTATRGVVSNGLNDSIVTSLELPFTVQANNRLQFTISPKVAFLPEDNALYLHRAPIDKPGSFGTTFGFATGVSYQLNSRLSLWGDAFVPLTGNNTINRNTGAAARFIAFNAGLRYLVNPRLATDLFVSNTLGNTGALSMIADREYPSLGLGVTFLPGVTGANRQYPQHFSCTPHRANNAVAGFGFLDGGTVASQQLVLNAQQDSEGTFTGFRYGLLDDLEIGAFIDSVPGTTDESELGVTGKINFLRQTDGQPFTLSGAFSVGRSNNVLVNLINHNPHYFQQQGLKKGGFAISNEKEGELFILTLSAPMHYQFHGGSAIWLTPTLGYLQRSGLEIAGFNFGGSVPVIKNLDGIAEAGVNLTGRGNALIGNSRENAIPWIIGLRWFPSISGIPSGLQLQGYVTNRVGSAPFQSLRVRADNDTAVGVGVEVPIQF